MTTYISGQTFRGFTFYIFADAAKYILHPIVLDALVPTKDGVFVQGAMPHPLNKLATAKR